ncbi:MAG: peptidylprolyl isomerase [Candidatus Hydrogenedentota bacterium]
MLKALSILKDPLIQFVLIGAAIFVLYGFSQTAEQSRMDSRIVVDAPTQAWIYDNFKKQFRRPPSRLEMVALVDAHIEAEVKVRHALAMGLDDRDSIVRRRLMQKFDFLFGDAAVDIVPENEVLQAWYVANESEFLAPSTISFSQVYFSPDKRESASSDAQAALVAHSEDSKPRGDSFPFEVEFDRATWAEVRNVLGPEFAEAVFAAPLSEWSGPIRSGLGTHLVFVNELVEGSLPPFLENRDAVLQRWREAESKNILEDLIVELESQFEIDVDEESLQQFEYGPDDRVALP